VRCARDAVEPRQLHVEHVAVDEQQRLQCLVLRGAAHLALHREVREELLDRGCAELARMAAMKGDITLEPLQIRLLGTQCQVPRAHTLACQGEQPRRCLQVGVWLGQHACNPSRHGSRSARVRRAPNVPRSPCFSAPRGIIRGAE